MIKLLCTTAASLITAVPVAASLVQGPTGTASAGVQDVTCTAPSSQSDTCTPPLTLTPQSVTVGSTTRYGPCVSLSNPAITSDSRTRTLLVPGRSCLDLLNSGSTTFTITSNTGQSSAISSNFTSTTVGATLVVTDTGTVTSGLFIGSTVVQVLTAPAADVLLRTAGLTTVSGIHSLMTLEITSL